jgi:putative Mg2+ transporter-C (MgtC) family protein
MVSLDLQFKMIFQLCLALVLGGVIGFEREKYSKPAGLRTHMILAIGCTMLTILSYTAFPDTTDTSRLAAAIITGIGFIGAGTVMQTRERVVGLTTAASIWLTASVSLAVGTSNYLLAVVGTILGYIVLESKPIQIKREE